jgi:branched-chain amino acid transport system substrate-binding protein
MRLRTSFAAAALLLVTALAGSAAEPPLEINTILSLTGQAAFIGTTYAKTLQALETSVNKSGGLKGRSVHFAIQDDQSSPQVAVQLANGLLAAKVNAILGPNLTATCRAVAPLVEGGPMTYCLSPSVHPPKGSFMFSVGVDTRDQTIVITRFLRERGWHDIGMLVTTDASGQDAETAFADALKLPENRGMRFVDIEHFNITDPTISAQLARLQAAQPQAIIAWATGTPMGTLLRGLQENAIGLPVMMNNANSLAVQMKSFASIIPPQLYSYGPESMLASANVPRTSAPAQNYFRGLRNAGIESDYITGLVWDPAEIVLEALRRAGPNASAAQLRDYILHLNDFRGIAGSFDFTDGSQRGLGQKNMLAMRWDPAKNVWVATSKLGGTIH